MVRIILFLEDVKLIDCDAATEDTTTTNTLGNNIISAPKLQFNLSKKVTSINLCFRKVIAIWAEQ